MLKRIYSTLAVLALLLVMNSNTFAQQIAYVDMDEITKQMPDYKRVQADLESYQKVLEKQIQSEEKKMQDYYQGVMQQMQAGTMSPAQQKEAEAKLVKMQEDLQKKAANAEKQIVEKEQELSKPIIEKLNAAIKAVAAAQKYSYILDKKLLLYSDGGIDATSKLKSQLGIP
jgi:outer membrane protein